MLAARAFYPFLFAFVVAFGDAVPAPNRNAATGHGTFISDVPAEFRCADSEIVCAGHHDRYGRMVRGEWPRAGIATAPGLQPRRPHGSKAPLQLRGRLQPTAPRTALIRARRLAMDTKKRDGKSRRAWLAGCWIIERAAGLRAACGAWRP